MRATTRIIGLGDLTNKLESMGHAVSGEHLGSAVLVGAQLVEQAAKLSMGEAKSGRMYGEHQASAPGEAPAVDTGQLFNSVQSEIVETSSTSAWAQAGVTGSEYGEALEYGTARIMPRPFMRPALDNNVERIVAGIRAALEHLVTGAARG